MKKIYLFSNDVDAEDDDENALGEYEAFFDDNKKFLAGWSLNDAQWRDEYMDGLMQALGYEVVIVPADKEDEYKTLVLKEIGYIE